MTGDQGDGRAHHHAEPGDEEELPTFPLPRYLGVEVGHDGEQYRSHQEGDRGSRIHVRIITKSPIHRSAWKGYSANFALRGFSEVR
jgi:hypothetical protein